MVGSRPAKGRPPLRLALPPLLEAGLAAVGRCPCGRSPLAGSQAMAGRPYRGLGCGQPPLHVDSIHVAAPPPQVAPTFAANRCNKRVE
ncbi:hypothetical protein GW17_00061561 [Ensete ventricosum]|nr:hypothetical protein GW17_00061561 [Ensete ventricosum]